MKRECNMHSLNLRSLCIFHYASSIWTHFSSLSTETTTTKIVYKRIFTFFLSFYCKLALIVTSPICVHLYFWIICDVPHCFFIISMELKKINKFKRRSFFSQEYFFSNDHFYIEEPDIRCINISSVTLTCFSLAINIYRINITFNSCDHEQISVEKKAISIVQGFLSSSLSRQRNKLIQTNGFNNVIGRF